MGLGSVGSDIVVGELAGFGLASVMARKRCDIERLSAALGMDVPNGPAWSGDGDVALIGTGPGTWLVFTAEAPLPWIDDLRLRLRDVAAVSNQSAAYCLFHLSGSSARTVLQRGAAIDLHPASFSPGSVATTVIARIGVVIRQIDESPVFEVATSRSHAASFRHWLDGAVAAL